MSKWKGIKINTGYATNRTYDTEKEALEAIKKIVEMDDEQLSLYYAIKLEEQNEN